MKLEVSPNHRFLRYADGRPFFYLADTAWELFHRCTREEARTYLETRAAQGFTVIQAVMLAEFDGLREPNAYGRLPLRDENPATPDDSEGGYWDHVDGIVRTANELGLVVGALPTWGDKWNRAWGKGPEAFTPTASGSGAATATPGSSGSSAATVPWRRRRTGPSSRPWRRGCAKATAARTS